MRSTEIKNWQYTLPYKKIVELDDFSDILMNAIVSGNCILCGSIKGILHNGLCSECSRNLKGEDKRVSEYIRKNLLIKLYFPKGFKQLLNKIIKKYDSKKQNKKY